MRQSTKLKLTTVIFGIGPDPADPNRVLVRKIIQVSDKKYALEEITVTPQPETGVPSVHSQATRVHQWDMKDDVSRKEELVRLAYRPMPNVVAFSMYYRKLASGSNHFSIVENTLWKPSLGSWRNLFVDWCDRRDLSRYLRQRWLAN